MAIDEGRELICVDESSFTSKGPKRAHWAPSGRPLEWDKRFYPGSFVAVCGATSVLRGVVYYKTHHGEAFTKVLFMEFLRGLHNRCRQQPIAILMDNPRIHPEEEVEAYADKFDIRILWNVKYRADFNGIELVWGWAKREYRKKVDWLKANGIGWKQPELVEEVLASIPTEFAVTAARKGFACIEVGKPVRSKRFVEGPKHDLKLGDLSAILKPNPTTKRQYEDHVQASLKRGDVEELSEDEEAPETKKKPN